MMSKIVLVRGSEWEGLYVDGLLYSEDHTIDMRVMVELSGGTVRDLTDKQDTRLGEDGGLPKTLSELEEDWK